MDEETFGRIVVLVLWAILDTFLAWLVMLLWNWIMVYPEIEFWMAFVVVVITSLISGRKSSDE